MMMLRWSRRLMLVVLLGVLAGCTGSDSAPEPVEIWIRAGVILCASETEGDSRDCGDVPLPHADITITSSGETVWTGQTGNSGSVEVSLYEIGEFVVTVSNSPFVPEELVSDPVTPDLDVQPAAIVTLFTEDLYVLTALPASP